MYTTMCILEISNTLFCFYSHSDLANPNFQYTFTMTEMSTDEKIIERFFRAAKNTLFDFKHEYLGSKKSRAFNKVIQQEK
jgi:hypothetical protein